MSRARSLELWLGSKYCPSKKSRFGHFVLDFDVKGKQDIEWWAGQRTMKDTGLGSGLAELLVRL